MTFEERRRNFYAKYNISFEFLYSEYNLQRIPFDRPRLSETNTLDKYCSFVRALHSNILRGIESHEDDYISNGALEHFEAVLGKNWDERLGKIEKLVYDYNENLLRLYNEQIEAEIKSKNI